MKKVFDILTTVFNYDQLYISGGNAQLLTCKLEKIISIDDNKEGKKRERFYESTRKLRYKYYL